MNEITVWDKQRVKKYRDGHDLSILEIDGEEDLWKLEEKF